MTIALTRPDQIAAFRLASLRARIKLEKLGMRHSAGSTRALIAAELGLKPRASHDTFIAELTRRIEALLPGSTAKDPQ